MGYDKRKYETAKRYGLTREEARRRAYWGEKSWNKEVKRLEKNQANRERQKEYKENQKYLESIGFDKKTARANRTFTRFDQVIKTVPVHNQNPRLMIYWREKTQEYGMEDFRMQRQLMRMRGVEGMLAEARYYKDKDFGYIGDYVVEVVADTKRAIQQSRQAHSKYSVVYSGHANRYSDLLSAVTTMLIALYTESDKDFFLQDLFNALDQVNSKMSDDLSESLGFDRLGDDDR